MKHNIKITKREIKEDKFTTFVFRAKDFVGDRWTYFAAGLAAVIIVIVGITYIQSRSTAQENNAIDVYNRALSELRMGNYQLSIVDFKTVIDQYGSTSQAKMAAFNLGNAYFAAKNFTEAKAAFEIYLKKHADNKFFVTSAMEGIAASLAGMGEYKAAADKYRETAEKYPDFRLAGEYYLRALENYIKADEMESARVMLAKITNDFENTQYYSQGARLAAEHGLRL
jgi:outer membrane protein assembly factor BamD (BamD/ComL family)